MREITRFVKVALNVSLQSFLSTSIYRPLQTYSRSLLLLIRFLSFTRETPCCSHGPVSMSVSVCVCWSVTNRCSIETDEWIEGTFFHLSWVSSKIIAFPYGTLSRTPDLENIASAYRLSKRLSSRNVDAQSAINWTVVGQLSWQYIELSTAVVYDR